MSLDKEDAQHHTAQNYDSDKSNSGALVHTPNALSLPPHPPSLPIECPFFVAATHGMKLQPVAVSIGQPLFYLSSKHLELMDERIPRRHLLSHFVNVLQNTDTKAMWIMHSVVVQATGHPMTDFNSAVAKYGGNWCWAPEFSNMHTTFTVQECGLCFRGVTFVHGPEGLYQLFKLKEHLRDAMIQAVALQTDYEAWEWGNSIPQSEYISDEAWNSRKRSVMKQVLKLKFKCPVVRSVLEMTKGVQLVQLKNDSFWGHPGSNVLGLLLADIRDYHQCAVKIAKTQRGRSLKM